MTKGDVAMPAIQRVAVLGFSLLLLAVNQQANAQQKMEFKFNLQDLLPAGKQEAAPDQPVRPAENQAVPVEQKPQKATARETTRDPELDRRRAERAEMFKEIRESEQKRRKSNMALAETFVSGEAPYWIRRAEQCHEIMLKAKAIPDRERWKNPEGIASIADETMECLWSLENDLRSRGELARLESCFAETFEKLPARARAESQHGILLGEEYVIVGATVGKAHNKKVKNEFGIKNRPLIYLETMWRATAEMQSSLSYTQLYKMLFFDVSIPIRELKKTEIAGYQREKELAKRSFNSARLDKADEYLKRMAGPEGDAAETPEQTRSRLARFAECSPLGPMLGMPLPLIQKQSAWTFAAANTILDKRTENIKSQKLEKAKEDLRKRIEAFHEARLQNWRKRLKTGSETSAGTIANFSQDGKMAQVEKGVCVRGDWIPEEVENYWGMTFIIHYYECHEYKVTERSWKNISELHP